MMRGLVALGAAAMLLASCSFTEHVSAAEAAIGRFHATLNAGRSAAIYAAAGPDLKAVTTAQAFGQLLDAVHRKLGTYRTGKPIGWNDNHTTGGEFVTVNFDADYERGKAQENFVYRITDKGAELVGYHVNSDALILD